MSNVIVYTPDRILKMGFWAVYKQMFVDLYRSRELITRLFITNFLSKYRQSLLGILWAVINPLVIMGIFVYLHKSGIFNIGVINVPYPAFVLVGLSCWTLFATGLIACSNSLITAGSLVTKINFPKSSLVISSMGEAVVDFIIRLIITAIVFCLFRITPAWTCIFFPLMVIPLILLTLGMGFLLSLLTGIFRDIPNAVSLFTTLLLFVVPVLYPVPQSEIFACINNWNPLSYLISSARDIVFIGYITSPVGYFYSSVFCLVVFGLCWRVFYLAESKIAERI